MIIRGEPERPLDCESRRCRCRSSGRSSAACRRTPPIATPRRATSRAICRRCAITAADLDTLDGPRLAARTRRPRLLVAAIAMAAALGVAGTAVYFASRPGPRGAPGSRPRQDSSSSRSGAASYRMRGSRRTARRSSMRPGGTAGRSGSSKRVRLGPESRPIGPAACRPGQHLLGWRGGADSGLSARLGELRRHARQDAAGRRRPPRSAGRRRQRGLDARRPGARRHPGDRWGVSAPVSDRQVAL